MLLTALRISLRRTLANFRLTLAVVLGALLAVVIMATTVVYFEALRDIALGHSLSQADPDSLDLLVTARQVPVNPETDASLRDTVESSLHDRIRSFLDGDYRALQSFTFLVNEPPPLVPRGQCPCRPNGIATGPGDVPVVNSDGTVNPYHPDALLACDCRRVSCLTVPDLDGSVRLVAGEMPEPQDAPPGSGDLLTIPALLDAAGAAAAGLSVGDTLPIRPFWDSPQEQALIQVVGIYEREDPAALHWRIMDEQFSDRTGGLEFSRFVIPEETFINSLGTYFPDMGAQYAWLLDVAPDKIHATDTGGIRGAIGAADMSLRAVIDGFRIQSGLAGQLENFEVNLFFNRIPMLIVLSLVVAVALYYAAMVASVLVASQRTEVALMRSRGAAAPQIFGVYVIEALVLALIAFGLGPLLALTVVRLIGKVPFYSDLNGGEMLPVQLTANVVLVSALGALLCFLALLIPAYRATRLNVLSERRSRARPGRFGVVQKYYLDLGLLGLVGLLFWQLTRSGSFVATDVFGETTVNNLTLAVPALLIIFASVALLRLFPLLTEGAVRLLGSRVGSLITPSSLFLGIRQLARNPGGHARLSLLLVISAALGVFAATFASTLERSAREQVLYENPAEFIVSGVSYRNFGGRSASALEQLKTLEGVESVSAVMRAEGITDSLTAVGTSDRFQVLGIDTGAIADVSWSREDFLGGSLDDFAGQIAPEIEPGMHLPEDSLFISALVKPLVIREDVMVVARMSDGNGRFYSVPLGDLRPHSAASNRFNCPSIIPGQEPQWCRVGSSMFPAPTQGLSTIAPRRPVTLHSIGIVSTDGPLSAGALLIDDIEVLDNTGRIAVKVETFDSLDAWRLLEPTAESLGDGLAVATDEDGNDMPGIARFQWTDAREGEYRGLSFGATEPVIPVIASPSFAEMRDAATGDELTVQVSGVRMRIRPVGTTEFFPTLNDDESPFVIVDLDTLVARLNLQSISADQQPGEFWINVAQDEDGNSVLTPEQITTQLRSSVFGLGQAINSGPVIEQESRLAAIEVDPLTTTGWQALLGIAFAAVLIVSSAGYLVHARASFRQRRHELALFRTVGLSRWQLFALITVEQVLVVGVAVGIGVFLGTRLGDTIFPFLAASGRSGSLAPPMVVQFDAVGLGVVFGIFSVVFTIVIGLVLWSVTRMAVHSLMRAGDG